MPALAIARFTDIYDRHSTASGPRYTNPSAVLRTLGSAFCARYLEQSVGCPLARFYPAVCPGSHF